MSPDIVNSIFEVFGGIFIATSIHRLFKDKEVKGVSWYHACFFAVWGYWNLYFYPSLDQWWSFWGGVGVVTANTIWLGQLIYYTRRPRGKSCYTPSI